MQSANQNMEYTPKNSSNTIYFKNWLRNLSTFSNSRKGNKYILTVTSMVEIICNVLLITLELIREETTIKNNPAIKSDIQYLKAVLIGKVL